MTKMPVDDQVMTPYDASNHQLFVDQEQTHRMWLHHVAWVACNYADRAMAVMQVPPNGYTTCHTYSELGITVSVDRSNRASERALLLTIWEGKLVGDVPLHELLERAALYLMEEARRLEAGGEP
jgi:hypothetical protein